MAFEGGEEVAGSFGVDEGVCEVELEAGIVVSVTIVGFGFGNFVKKLSEAEFRICLFCRQIITFGGERCI